MPPDAFRMYNTVLKAIDEGTMKCNGWDVWYAGQYIDAVKLFFICCISYIKIVTNVFSLCKCCVTFQTFFEQGMELYLLNHRRGFDRIRIFFSLAVLAVHHHCGPIPCDPAPGFFILI